MSPAETYIAQQVFQLDQSQVPTPAHSLNERINDWREGQIRHVYKHSPNRYKYGTPPSTSRR